MTTKTFSLFCVCLLLGALMLACGGGGEAGGSSSTASGDKIGVAECDDFIQKYEACVNSKVPESMRSMVRTNTRHDAHHLEEGRRDASGQGRPRARVQAGARPGQDGDGELRL